MSAQGNTANRGDGGWRVKIQIQLQVVQVTKQKIVHHLLENRRKASNF